MIDIKHALENATTLLKPTCDSARLDAELLLAHVLSTSRAFLYTHPEDVLSPLQEEQYQQVLTRRAAGVPFAYLTGTREFWSLPLRVTEDTLIPRPETELLVELALMLLRHNLSSSHALSSPRRQESTPDGCAGVNSTMDPRLRGDDKQISVLDLGTGSGAIALALASERPHWHVLACDKSQAALNIARDNAGHLNLTNIDFLCSDWFQSIPEQQFNVIVSNPPYIAELDIHLSQGDLRFEPQDALVSGVDGLDALTHIIKNSYDRLAPNGWLLLEHGFAQGAAVTSMLKQFCYQEVQCWQDWQGHDRVSGGRKE